MKIILQSFFGLVLLTLGCQATSLEQEISQEYKRFQPSPRSSLCKAVQFIQRLQTQNTATAPQKIALILRKGAGVGGISKRPATSEEQEAIFSVLQAIVRPTHDIKELGFKTDDCQSSDRHLSFVTGAAYVLKNSPNKINWQDPHEQDLLRYHANQVPFSVQNSNLSFEKKGPRVLPYLDAHVGVSQQYHSSFPKAPMLHPYHPGGNSQLGAVPYLPMRAKFPIANYRKALPQNVQQHIQGILDQNLDLFFIVQGRAWDDTNDDKDPLLFRAHYWMDPNAPRNHLNYSYDVWTSGTFLKVPFGSTLKQDETIFNQQVYIHSVDNQVRSSPNNFSIEHLLTYGQDLAFFSLVQNPQTGRYALTLHWLLTSDGIKAIAPYVEHYPIPNFKSFAELMLQNDRFRKLYHFAF